MTRFGLGQNRSCYMTPYPVNNSCNYRVTPRVSCIILVMTSGCSLLGRFACLEEEEQGDPFAAQEGLVVWEMFAFGPSLGDLLDT